LAESGERRMLFDIRGRRKHVVRVVYAILALLMGASLFLVVGPFNIGNLINNGSSTTEASKVLNEQAERIEKKLAQNPNDEALLLTLTRTRISAAKSQTETNPETGVAVYTPEGRQSLERATEVWSRYLKQTKEPNASAALLVAGSYFSLAEQTAGLEVEEYLEKAADTQRIAAAAQPTINSLTTLAIYDYYNGDFAAGDKATAEAAAKAPSKAEAKEVKKQMAEFRQRGKTFEIQKKEFEKEEKSRGKERLQNPLGGLGGSTGSFGG